MRSSGIYSLVTPGRRGRRSRAVATALRGGRTRRAACYPSPLDRTGLQDDAAHDRAVSSLQRTCSRLGFRPYRDLNLGTTALSEALPQPDREEWEAGLARRTSRH